MSTMKPYRMSFSTGGLFLNESVDLARLRLRLPDWQATLTQAAIEGLTSLPKSASRRRTLREIANRLSCLSDDELSFLVEEADRQEQASLLWVAACRAYRLVREFAVEVIQDRYLSFHMDLPLETFDRLYEAKAEWDEDLAAISRSTFLKLRQVLFRMMREAAIINEDNRIVPSYLSLRLRNLIGQSHPSDLAVFPGMLTDRG